MVQYLVQEEGEGVVVIPAVASFYRNRAKPRSCIPYWLVRDFVSCFDCVSLVFTIDASTRNSCQVKANHNASTSSQRIGRTSQLALCLRCVPFSHNASERKHQRKHKKKAKFRSLRLSLCLSQARFDGEINKLSCPCVYACALQSTH